MSIPRLELTAATLLVKLVKYVRKMLNLESTQAWLWTDSMVSLSWITNQPSKWKDFVRNRVSVIQETEPLAKWRYVAGNENPADCASRGVTAKILSNHKLWWTGPPWLNKDVYEWPSTTFDPAQAAKSELRIPQSTCHILNFEPEPEMLERFSTLSKLLRVTAWCQKFIAKTKQSIPTNCQSFLTPQDLNSSLLLWVKLIQKHAFKNELARLQNNRPLEKSNLISLNPFVDNTGLMRVGGRLEQSSLEYDSKHPYILPKNSKFSKLVIDDAHLRTLHSGTRCTLATVRQKFWVVGGRPIVKRELLKCVTCARYRSQRAQQLMGQLPPTRTSPSRPFLHSGVDYAGPFVIKTWHGKRAKTYKGYIAVFICSATSAIHLELVSNYSAEAFIAAYKRFTSRRGICATLTSDCGTTFVGADKELKRLFSSSSAESGQLKSLLANDGTEWKFNPPAAPHFGGHWEAGVKSVKYHLKRVMKTHLLTYEEFSTVLVQIEAVLNSRPLCQLTEDPDDLAILTPAHFLVGESLTTIPEPNQENQPTSRLTRWKLTRQMLESFWKKWSREYLQQLQAIYKWRFPSCSIKLGSVVLVVDEQLPPSKWPLARVTELHPGRDGLTRVATLRTSSTSLKRPIVKLCPLPIEVSD
ncbi:uncharacterized protein LOC129004885 [Macrosteles quadrilineatus]|uniref:uncharacterized protein LOC129004885 n=1 Tax=Macrosteles quadrilineatus TaxID=74068 RepID=UPI0023E1757B|nr:uncharacterized protein LOC129004885 [Macrosteles quadrilineatus]